MIVSTGTGGSPLPLLLHVRMAIMGKMKSSKSPRILIDWDFSHLDGIIETVLQQKPDHNVYLWQR